MPDGNTSFQARLRAWVLRRAARLGVTKAALARAIDRDESLVRRMLCDHADVKIDFERLIAWAPLLQLANDELVQLWADLHDLDVDVTPRIDDDEEDEETPTLVLQARLSESAGRLAGLSAEARTSGVVSTASAAAAVEAGAKTSRYGRTVAARVMRRSVGSGR